MRIIGILLMASGPLCGAIILVVRHFVVVDSGAAAATAAIAVVAGLDYGFMLLVAGQVVELALTVGEDVHNMLDRL
jgi:hypothetical protein